MAAKSLFSGQEDLQLPDGDRAMIIKMEESKNINPVLVQDLIPHIEKDLFLDPPKDIVTHPGKNLLLQQEDLLNLQKERAEAREILKRVTVLIEDQTDRTDH